MSIIPKTTLIVPKLELKPITITTTKPIITFTLIVPKLELKQNKTLCPCVIFGLTLIVPKLELKHSKQATKVLFKSHFNRTKTGIETKYKRLYLVALRLHFNRTKTGIETLARHFEHNPYFHFNRTKTGIETLNVLWQIRNNIQTLIVPKLELKQMQSP